MRRVGYVRISLVSPVMGDLPHSWGQPCGSIPPSLGRAVERPWTTIRCPKPRTSSCHSLTPSPTSIPHPKMAADLRGSFVVHSIHSCEDDFQPIYPNDKLTKIHTPRSWGQPVVTAGAESVTREVTSSEAVGPQPPSCDSIGVASGLRRAVCPDGPAPGVHGPIGRQLIRGDARIVRRNPGGGDER
jgi:hypothetical protein